MAASITHIVAGERVFKQIPQLDPSIDVYGSFLAGCAIVDVNAFHDIDRRVTHFVGRLDTDGEDAYRKSCTNFLLGLDQILKKQSGDLSQAEQAFVIGYLCHLAVDECWKELSTKWYQKLNITNWKDFPVHPDVMLTAFDCLSRNYLIDPVGAFAALEAVNIPDIFTHVPYETFCHQWQVILGYLKSDGDYPAYVDMLKRAGRFNEKNQTETERRFNLWPDAIQLIDSAGGAFQFIQDATAHSDEKIQMMSQSLNRESGVSGHLSQ